LLRFRIERKRFWPDSYKLHIAESVIVASVHHTFLDRRALAWTWNDGAEYAWLRPKWPNEERLLLVSGEKTLCSGECFLGRRKGNRGKTFVTVSQWEIGAQTILLQGSQMCCGYFPRVLTLRQEGGQRLACWVAGRLEGALRQDTPRVLVPVLVGIVLTTAHDFWGTSGS
jgi:hypothetical protein